MEPITTTRNIEKQNRKNQKDRKGELWSLGWCGTTWPEKWANWCWWWTWLWWRRWQWRCVKEEVMRDRCSQERWNNTAGKMGNGRTLGIPRVRGEQFWPFVQKLKIRRNSWIEIRKIGTNMNSKDFKFWFKTITYQVDFCSLHPISDFLKWGECFDLFVPFTSCPLFPVGRFFAASSLSPCCASSSSSSSSLA